jgi:hypothetical protein
VSFTAFSKRYAMSGANRLARDLFGRRRHAIKIKACDHEEVHEHRIGSKRYGAEARADPGHDGEGRDQREGADEDVPVEPEERHQLWPIGHHRDLGHGVPPVAPEDEGKAGEHRDDLANHRAPSDTGNAEAEGDAEQDRHCDVDAIEQDLQRKPDGAQPASEHEAEQGEVGQCHRGSENADADIDGGCSLYAALGTHQCRTEADDGRGGDEDGKSEAERQRDRPPEKRRRARAFRRVPAPAPRAPWSRPAGNSGWQTAGRKGLPQLQDPRVEPRRRCARRRPCR